MDFELLKVRALSFMWEAGTMIVLGILAVLSSPEFAGLIQTHFGDTLTASIILLTVSGVVKHLRNVMVLNKASVGGEGKSIVLI